MFLGDDRLRSLECYISGVFNYCNIERGAKELVFLQEFGAWQYEALKEQRSGIDPVEGSRYGGAFWCLMVRRGEEALASEFFDELEKFLRQRGYKDGLSDKRLDLEDFTPFE